jgi:hypothetical protein
MVSRHGRPIARVILLLLPLVLPLVLIGLQVVFGARLAAASTGNVDADVRCTIPMTCALDTANQASNQTVGQTAGQAPDKEPATPEESEEPKSKTHMANEEISLYKTISYVTGATLTDQLWYIFIASEAATTGGLFMAVNATTSSMMTYSYEYMWNICCLADPGPDGIVPISATKAIIYRGLSIIRVGALALLFGNTIGSSAIVTTAITVSRTAVYVANDFVWNRVDASQKVKEPGTLAKTSPERPIFATTQTAASVEQKVSVEADGFFGMKAAWNSVKTTADGLAKSDGFFGVKTAWNSAFQ